MKAFLFSSLFLFFCINAFSQKVSLTELIGKTKCTEFSCFNEFITAKGFCYENTNNESPLGKIYRFSSCNFIKDGPKGIDTKNQCSFMLMTTGSVSADIGTSSNNYYQALLAESARLGFKSYETDDSESDVIHVQYKSPKYPKINLMFSTYKLSKEGVGNWTFWNFSIRRDK